MRRIRTKKGCLRRYKAVVNRLYRDHPGGLYGWDFPTLSICHPQIALKIRIIKRLYKILP